MCVYIYMEIFGSKASTGMSVHTQDEWIDITRLWLHSESEMFMDADLSKHEHSFFRIKEDWKSNRVSL